MLPTGFHVKGLFPGVLLLSSDGESLGERTQRGVLRSLSMYPPGDCGVSIVFLGRAGQEVDNFCFHTLPSQYLIIVPDNESSYCGLEPPKPPAKQTFPKLTALGILLQEMKGMQVWCPNSLFSCLVPSTGP